MIAAQIGLCEEAVDINGLRRDLTDVGTSAALVPIIEGAVSYTATNNRAGITHTDAFTSAGGAKLERL